MRSLSFALLSIFVVLDGSSAYAAQKCPPGSRCAQPIESSTGVCVQNGREPRDPGTGQCLDYKSAAQCSADKQGCNWINRPAAEPINNESFELLSAMANENYRTAQSSKCEVIELSKNESRGSSPVLSAVSVEFSDGVVESQVMPLRVKFRSSIDKNKNIYDLIYIGKDQDGRKMKVRQIEVNSGDNSDQADIQWRGSDGKTYDVKRIFATGQNSTGSLNSQTTKQMCAEMKALVSPSQNTQYDSRDGSGGVK